MLDLAAEEGVYKVVGPMCRWALEENSSRGYLRKAVTWLTNSQVLAEMLKSQQTSVDERRQVIQSGGLAAAAAKYPPSLVKAILLGIKHRMLDDGNLSELQIHSAGPVAEEPVLTEDVSEEF